MNQTLLLLLIAILCAACSKSAGNISTPPAAETPRVSSVDVVKVAPQEVTITRGGTAEAQVRLNIDRGYHVNANPPTFSYLKPTELELTPSGGLTVSFTIYPNPLVKQFPFAEKPLAVYEGETIVKVRIKADRSAVPGRKNLSGKLRVQACDDQVCYAPGEKEISVPVNVQ